MEFLISLPLMLIPMRVLSKYFNQFLYILASLANFIYWDRLLGSQWGWGLHVCVRLELTPLILRTYWLFLCS